LSVEEVIQQHHDIDRLNRSYGNDFRILKGVESDILADGSLDYPDDVLERFDFVVASVHSRFKLDPKSQTDRIIRAVANPYTTILGHMTGRQLLRRPGYEVDIESILKACAAHGVAVEINANPWRLDLDWRWHQRSLELGRIMSINPDAHRSAGRRPFEKTIGIVDARQRMFRKNETPKNGPRKTGAEMTLPCTNFAHGD
jgi:DNA polymerase (family 10)